MTVLLILVSKMVEYNVIHVVIKKDNLSQQLWIPTLLIFDNVKVRASNTTNQLGAGRDLVELQSYDQSKLRHNSKQKSGCRISGVPYRARIEQKRYGSPIIC